MHFQQLLVGNVRHLLPDGRIVEAIAPVRLQVLIVERGQVAVQPAGQMHAVGDRGDGHLPNRQLRPHVVKHLLRYLAVQPADGIAVRRSVQRQHGHREALVAVVQIAAAQRHQLLKIDPHFGAVIRKVMVHQARIEQVDAGRHRRVGGEDIAGAGRFQGLVERQFFLAHEQPDLFQGEEGGMALVHVEDGGLQTHGLERAHAADAQHDLLPDARIVVAAVERIGDVAVLRQHVFRDVGIQQVQRDAPHLQLPHLDEDIARG